MTGYMWHLTQENWQMTHSGSEQCLKMSVSSCKVLDVMMFWRFGGKGWFNEGINLLFNEKDVCILIYHN